MAKVYEFLANGFEEVEALAPVDILRRGGVEVKMVSITGSNLVESSHGVVVKANLLFENITDFSDADLLMLPGGMPGSKNLNEHKGVRNALKEQFEKSVMFSKRRSALTTTPCEDSTRLLPVTLTILTSMPPRRRMSTGAKASTSSKPLARNSYTLAIIILFLSNKSN